MTTTDDLETAEVAPEAQPQLRNQHGRWAPTADILPMSLTRIAKMTDIKKASLSKIMSGQQRPYLDQAVAIADTIGMPLEQLATHLTDKRQQTAA